MTHHSNRENLHLHNFTDLISISCAQKDGETYKYEWINDVSLNKRKDRIRVKGLFKNNLNN